MSKKVNEATKFRVFRGTISGLMEDCLRIGKDEFSFPNKRWATRYRIGAYVEVWVDELNPGQKKEAPLIHKIVEHKRPPKVKKAEGVKTKEG